MLRPQPGGVNQRRRPRHQSWWGSDLHRPRVLAVPRRCSRRLLGQATDVSVAQAVVDEGEQLAGRGDLADVGAASGTDAHAGAGERAAADALDCLDGGVRRLSS